MSLEHETSLSLQGRHRWEVARPRPAEAQTLAAATGVSMLTAQLLLNRGMEDPDEALGFLRPTLTSLTDPAALPDINLATDRIQRALRDGERIAIHGDYDVDGLCGSAILARLLQLLGHEPSVHVPERLGDGYGVRVATVERLAEEGHSLLVTVDTGTSAVEAVARARELGLDVVVTDHHEPPPALPEGALIVNPKLPGHGFPCRSLSGSGVAYHLAWALAVAVSGSRRVTPALREFLLESLALVALGTVADLVPLRSTNRVLVTEGLARLGRTRHPGLRALLQVARRSPPLQVNDVAFHLAPRLNAAGRMGKVDLAYRLLTATSTTEARQLARVLDAENRRRRDLERDVLGSALDLLERRPELAEGPLLVLGQEGWHAGVVGIVASRLVERFHRPVILASFDPDGLGRGSCRTVPGFHLHEALEACGEHLLSHGGHAAAAGFEVEASCFEAFRAALQATGEQMLQGQAAGRASLQIDAEVTLDQVDERLLGELQSFQPCGEGNPPPILCARGLRVAGAPRRVGGSGEHLSFHARQEGQPVMRAIAFRHGALQERLPTVTFDAAFRPILNEWKGQRQVELEIRELRQASGSSSLVNRLAPGSG